MKLKRLTKFRHLMMIIKKIIKKLLFVLLLAAIFMVAEIVGGIMAGSVAILSDAAHMFSDLLGFAISIISVWISGLPANKKYSYGFHRAGVLGALTSVLVIWILTGFLIYFAVLRMIHIDEIEVHGKIMFGIACFGLLTNLIMIKVLHGGHDHHGHGHSHDHHGHKHTKKVKGGVQSHDDEHNHEHAHNHKHEHEHNHKIQSEQLADQEKNEIPNLGEDYKIIIDDGNKSNSIKSAKTDCGRDDKSKEGCNENGPKNLSNPDSKDNLNVRATIVHILGDIFQSIGVVIASILIWINPDKLKIADPIITFVFGIVILFTTVKIVRDCIAVLMEGTPMELKLDEFEGKIKLLEGVNEIHDFARLVIRSWKTCHDCSYLRRFR